MLTTFFLWTINYKFELRVEDGKRKEKEVMSSCHKTKTDTQPEAIHSAVEEMETHNTTKSV